MILKVANSAQMSPLLRHHVHVPAHTVGQTCPGSKAMGSCPGSSRPGADMGQSHHHLPPSRAPELYWSCQFYVFHSRARGTLLGRRGDMQSSWQTKDGAEVGASTMPPDRDLHWSLATDSARWAEGAPLRAQRGAPGVPEQRLSCVWGRGQPVPAACRARLSVLQSSPLSPAPPVPSHCPPHQLLRGTKQDRVLSRVWSLGVNSVTCLAV